MPVGQYVRRRGNWDKLYGPDVLPGVVPATFVDSTLVSGIGALTIAWPLHAIGDIALLLVETANQVSSLTVPSGFVELPSSPQGTGTAAGTAATRLTAFWCRAVTSTMDGVVVADSGDHQLAKLLTFRGAVAQGDPWEVTAGDVLASAGTAINIPGGTTTIANCLVVAAVANATDTSTPQVAGFTNADLTNVTEIADDNVIDGNGGGIAVAIGVKVTPGVYGVTTGTLATSSVQGRISLALKPKGAVVSASSPGLRLGITRLAKADYGTGPGGDTGAPIWRSAATYLDPSLSALATQTEIDARVTLANTYDMILLVQLAGSYQEWCTVDGNGRYVFSKTLYEASVRKYETITSVATAAAGPLPRIIFYLADEPHAAYFATPKPDVNWMGLLHKQIWPGCWTIVREDSSTVDPNMAGVDYCISQYEGKHHNPGGGKSPGEYFAGEKVALAAIGYGMIPALNWLDGGGITGLSADAANCWDYLFTGSSKGRIGGTYTSGGIIPGTGYSCALQSDSTNTRWTVSPTEIRAFGNAVVTDLDAPVASLWAHAPGSFGGAFDTLEYRADFQSAFDDVITLLATRSQWNGMRTAK